ncbi:MAG TPA: SLC13 family permease, partial [Dehalococcoidales bacterium]
MLDLSQILALTIFVLLFTAIVIGRVHRFIPALVGAGLTLVVVFLVVMKKPEAISSVLNLGQLGQLNFWIAGQEHVETHGVNWQTIIFIGGMMTMVESMGEVGFFNWLCLSVARRLKY